MASINRNQVNSVVSGVEDPWLGYGLIRIRHRTVTQVNSPVHTGWARDVQVPKVRKIVEVDREAKDFVRKIIAEHRDTFDEDNVRDFVDIYLKTEKRENESGALTDINMLEVIDDLFLAGTETTSTTLRWGFLFLVLNPDIQAKCRQEILQVVGQVRTTGMKDRGKLPFTEAAILEIHRLGSISEC
ncbi:Cytochrome P450 2C20 [Lamellibrachia satsuma]|nr:Cytochrome P450 2C20 [Lamellibrachia satsuma]